MILTISIGLENIIDSGIITLLINWVNFVFTLELFIRMQGKKIRSTYLVLV